MYNKIGDNMDIIKYAFLGLVQGITEALPISSSGHVFIFRELLGMDFLYDMNFDILVNFGSLVAILLLYKKDLINIIKDFFLFIKTKEKKYQSNFKYALLLIIATIPAGIFGLIYKDSISKVMNLKLLGISFLMTSAFVFICRKIKGKKDDSKITILDSIIIGLYQIMALLPGVSRSGATISAGMSRDLKRESALKFSFLLYIPISLASMILGVNDLIKSPTLNTLWFPYLIATIIAGIATYYTFKWFRKMLLNNGKLIYFSIYTLLLGLTLLIVF